LHQTEKGHPEDFQSEGPGGLNSVSKHGWQKKKLRQAKHNHLYVLVRLLEESPI